MVGATASITGTRLLVEITDRHLPVINTAGRTGCTRPSCMGCMVGEAASITGKRLLVEID